MPNIQNGVGKTAAVARLKGRGRTVLVFHTCVRSSWMEILDGIGRFARACDWRLQVVEHVPPREAIAELVEFWRPDGVIVEGGMDENGIFNGDVFGKLPVVYLMCDERNLANELRVPDDGAILGIDDDENVTENASPER